MGEESIFRKKVQEWLKNNKAEILSVVAGSSVPVGFPDLLACWRGRYLAIEFKASGKKPRVSQLAQLKKIQDSGGLAFVVDPENWADIKTILLEIPAREPYIYNLIYNYLIDDSELITTEEDLIKFEEVINSDEEEKPKRKKKIDSNPEKK